MLFEIKLPDKETIPIQYETLLTINPLGSFMLIILACHLAGRQHICFGGLSGILVVPIIPPMPSAGAPTATLIASKKEATSNILVDSDFAIPI